MAVARTSAGFIKIRPVRPGAKIAIVAPASPLKQDSIADDVVSRGVAELRRLGFNPVFDERLHAQRGYTAGDAALRASSINDALGDPSIDAMLALRGGFGSAHLLPLVNGTAWAARRTALVGYSDVTSLHVWLNCHAGLVSIHGPMIDRRLSGGPEAYEPSSMLTALIDHPVGELPAPKAETLKAGPEVAGPVLGGTMSMLNASLGTPYAFNPPMGFVLYLDEVGERPYRLDRLLTQLKFAGILARASAVVCSGMRDCDEPAGGVTARDVIRGELAGFPGPIIFGLTSGHDTGEVVTIPFGVRGRVVTSSRARLIIEEAAASD